MTLDELGQPQALVEQFIQHKVGMRQWLQLALLCHRNGQPASFEMILKAALRPETNQMPHMVED